MLSDTWATLFKLTMFLPDWIQDSLRERHRKTRPFRPNSVTDRLNNLDGAPGYMWRAISRALEHGESYVIITLTGEFAGA